MDITLRERYLGICRFERTNDLYTFDEFWPQTLIQWVEEGAPEQIFDEKYRREYFQHGHGFYTPGLIDIRSGIIYGRGNFYDIGHGINLGDWWIPPIIPAFKPEIIDHDERTVTLVNGGGVTVRYLKDDPWSMPTFVDWPVKDRSTWKEYKKRLDPNTPERWPEDWDACVQLVKNLSLPISLQVGGFFGYLREWVGTEKILYMFYDDPELIEEMMDQMLYMEIEIIKRVVKDIKIDSATFWEDMCYRAGPLISPDMFRKFMMPRYRKITDLLHKHGINIIFVDSDGNVEKLIPLWLECGINYVWPLEVAAGNDAVALRKEYGKDLILAGNIDKRALNRDKAAVKEEVMSKVPYLLETGGYFPTVDHLVPPDVPLENYQYYINTMRDVAGLEKLSF